MRSYILSACRSAVCPRGGGFADLSVHALAAPVIRAALRRAGLELGQVDELILSNALGGGGNPARVAALAAGLPERVAGLSIDRQCAGGMDAVALAHRLIVSGAAEVVVAGGAESYSRAPLRLRTFEDGRPPERYDQPPFTPWPDRDPDMAEAADALGPLCGISRAAADDWAVQSHAKARAAPPAPDELVEIAGVATDPFARALSKRVCQRAKVITGDVTTANTAVAADAAGFVLVVSERIAQASGSTPIVIDDALTLGAAPERPGLAPLTALQTLMERQGRAPGDIGTVEIMEAYAVQAVACVQGAGFDPARVNPGGGALARGHPIGASGAINVIRLVHELRARGGTGIAGIAAAGGLASAMLLSA